MSCPYFCLFFILKIIFEQRDYIHYNFKYFYSYLKFWDSQSKVTYANILKFEFLISIKYSYSSVSFNVKIGGG